MHTKEPWTAMLKPPKSFTDHGWRAMAMCGQEWMVAAPASAVVVVEDGVITKTIWNSQANARRIVACVNLLEGHATEQIEGKTLEQYISDQAFISGITVHEGLKIGLNGLACQLLAASFAGQFKGSGAINYLEVSGSHPEIGNFTVTIQRNEGKTPHQFRLAAEQQRDELLAACKALLDHVLDHVKAADAASGNSQQRRVIKRAIDAISNCEA